jgi:PKD repeat protein
MKKLLFSIIAIFQMSFMTYSQVTFSASTTSGCAPLNVNFTTTSATGNYYVWDFFGVMPTLYVKNPSVVFNNPNPGGINVQLSVYDTTGAGMVYIGSANQMINVMGSGLYTNTDAVCPNEMLDIYVMPYGNSYNWNFGDGNTSTSSNPNHAYTSAGTYTISVSVNTSCGLQNLSHVINVQPGTIPTSEFFFNAPICPNEALGFDADNYNLQNYSWNFGDGTTLTGQNRPTHTYTAVGTYSAVLTVTSSCGTTSSTTKTVQIQGGLLVDPTTNINVSNSTVCPNDQIQFDFYPNAGVSYLWNFGNGATSILKTPVYSYTVNGVYTVSLTITNGCNNSATFTKTVSVSNSLPYSGGTNVSINPGSACPGSNINFDAPTASSYLWNFGDGTNSTLQNAVHNYSISSSYTVSVMLTNGCGNSTTVTNTVMVDPSIVPVINSNNWGSPTTSSCPGDSVLFYAYGGASYLWNFGDGISTTVTHTLSIQGNGGSMIIDVVKHAYSALGTYKVKLKYFNTCGNSASDSLNFTVGSTSPVNGGVTTTGSTFNTCQPTSFLAIGGTSYQWNFGDGNTANSTQTQVNHTYSVTGTYSVSVIVTNGCGNTGTYNTSVNIQTCVATGINNNTLNAGFNVYPNPFNGKTSIEVNLISNSNVTIDLFNISGEKVLEISNGELSKGKNIINVDASNLTNGIYFIKASTSTEVNVTKVILMK